MTKESLFRFNFDNYCILDLAICKHEKSASDRPVCSIQPQNAPLTCWPFVEIVRKCLCLNKNKTYYPTAVAVLWPSDAIWCSAICCTTLGKAMACCLAAPSWLPGCCSIRNKLGWHMDQITRLDILENVLCEMAVTFPASNVYMPYMPYAEVIGHWWCQ